jgi:MFS family permease
LIKNLQYYKFCLYGFLKNLRFYEPFFILFLLSKDMNFFRIGLLISIREITINLLEIPTGFISDIAGRRKTLLISFIFYIASFVIFYVSGSYISLAAAMVLYGTGDAFRTGTHKAMIFDYLENKGMSSLRVRYYGHTRAWSQTGSAISSLVAGIFVVITSNYSFVFLLAVLPYLLNLINIWSYPSWLDHPSDSATRNKTNYRDTLRNLMELLRKRGMAKVIINSSSVSGMLKSAESYLQPLLLTIAITLPFARDLEEESRSALLIGVIYFIIYLITAAASRRSALFTSLSGSESKGMNYSWLIFVLTAAVTGILYHTGFHWLALITFIILFSAENIRRPICVSRIAGEAGSAPLATVISTDSQMKSLFAAVISPVVGYFADMAGPGFGIAAVFATLLIVYPLVKVKA